MRFWPKLFLSYLVYQVQRITLLTAAAAQYTYDICVPQSNSNHPHSCIGAQYTADVYLSLTLTILTAAAVQYTYN